MTTEMKEIEYNRARNLITDDLEKLYEAKKILEELDDFKDSKEFLIDVNSKINLLELDLEEEKKEKYNRAVLLYKSSKTAQKLDQAIKLFNELGDYEDSLELIEKAKIERQKVAKKDRKNLDRLKLTGYLFAGIGVVMISYIVISTIIIVIAVCLIYSIREGN